MLAPHKNQTVSGFLTSSKHALFQGAVEGHVLAKNANNALPLKSPKLSTVWL